MTSRAVLVPATPEHVLDLGARMRAGDAAEVLASGGYTPAGAAADAVLWSEPGTARAGLIEGELAALFGVVRGSFASGVAYPWLLTTPTVDRRPAAFLRASRDVLEEWLASYPWLEQQVDARYAQALRWAARVGFTVHPPAPFGRAGLPFCRITLRRDRHV